VPGVAPIQTVLDRIPKRRAGTVQEVADACAVLLSSASEYITGQTIAVGGGLSITAPPSFGDVRPPLTLPVRPTR
jgi:enoyl-[acyl-carrier protein] reductase III